VTDMRTLIQEGQPIIYKKSCYFTHRVDLVCGINNITAKWRAVTSPSWCENPLTTLPVTSRLL